jgi:hypothetical protein
MHSTNIVSTTVQDSRCSSSWTVTGVYGPQDDLGKMFLRELKRLKNSVKPQWMLLKDFNLIYKVQDKSNDRLNRQMMLRFKRVLYHMEVKEVDLLDGKFI